MAYDPYNPLPRLNHEEQEGIELKRLFDVESSAEGYDQIDNSNKLRRWASLVVYKYSKCENFDAIVPYLAMTYFDLYISRGNPTLRVIYDIVRDIELLALCCLTLAWKMTDINFTIPKLKQRQPDLASLTTLEFQTVELQILKALDWNLRVVTAFCFVPYIVPKCITPHGFNPRTINEIIVGIQCHEDIGISIAKMKPSVIAASALVAATKFLYPRQYSNLVDRLIEEEILKEDHERRFAENVISACRAMNLVVESRVVQTDSAPPKRVRVQTGGWMRRTIVPAGETSNGMNFPLRWTPATGHTEAFVIFGSRTRIAWPHGQDAEQKTRQLVRIAFESAVRDLYFERVRLFCAGIVEHYLRHS